MKQIELIGEFLTKKFGGNASNLPQNEVRSLKLITYHIFVGFPPQHINLANKEPSGAITIKSTPLSSSDDDVPLLASCVPRPCSVFRANSRVRCTTTAPRKFVVDSNEANIGKKLQLAGDTRSFRVGG